MLPHWSWHHLDLYPQKTTLSLWFHQPNITECRRESDSSYTNDKNISILSISPKGNQGCDHLFLPHPLQSWQEDCNLTCERSAFESAPVFLIDGPVYTFSVSILVGQDFEEQTTYLAKGKWVRSHMIVWTHYPSFKPQFIARWFERLSQKP